MQTCGRHYLNEQGPFHVRWCQQNMVTTNSTLQNTVLMVNWFLKTCITNCAGFQKKKIARSFAVSNGLKQLFTESGISRTDRIETIHHGFDLPDNHHPPNSEYRFAQNQVVILGRIIPFKGHMKLIKALSIVKAELGDFKLVIVGHGDDNFIADLKQEIKVNQLESLVTFTGFQTNIYDYLNNSDLMVVPSVAEGFGLIFLEAMNSGLPIIGFDVPATNEIIEHETSGVLIPPYDEQQLGQAILELLGNEARRKALSEAAKNRLVSYFCLERMTKETLNFYNKTISGE